jgi:TolB-like protein
VHSHHRLRHFAESETGRTKVGSLAVLPFENESADVKHRILERRITETLINRLAEISALRVVARSTIFRYKGRKPSPQEVEMRSVLMLS